jgi:hypothetical protein
MRLGTSGYYQYIIPDYFLTMGIGYPAIPTTSDLITIWAGQYRGPPGSLVRIAPDNTGRSLSAPCCARSLIVTSADHQEFKYPCLAYS